MEVSIITNSNFMQYAMGIYKNPSCAGINEFAEDLSRIKYIKRLIRRYKKTGEIREQLIINHFIILSNVFTVVGSARLLFFKIEPELYPEIKTFMVYLGILPKKIPEADLVKIPLNTDIVGILRSLRST
jgi:hypothetical protein